MYFSEKKFAIILTFFFFLSTQAHSTISNTNDSFNIQGQLLSLDPLQQIYTVDSLQTLRKYSADGKALFNYQNRNLGRLAICDASDPFGILLFYPDFNTLIILDRTLNPLTELRLDEVQIYGAQAIATSLDKNIWLYDQQDFKLKKISHQGRLLLESADLSRWIDNGFKADHLVVQADALFLQSSEGTLLQFSPFGQFEKEISVDSAYFHFRQGIFYYCSDANGLYLWEPIQGKVQYLIQSETPVTSLAARPQFAAWQSGQVLRFSSW